MENWDEVWRRNQFVVAELARRHPETKILFVGLSRDFSHGLRTGNFGALAEGAPEAVPGLPNIQFTRPPKLFPNTLAAGRRMNDALARRHIRRTAAAMGMTNPILWLNPHSAVHMAGRMGERCVIYDITDDWISSTQQPWLRELTRSQDEALCRKADAVIVCSEHLYKIKRNLTTNLHLIPNGVDAAHYASVLEDGPLPATAQTWRKPVLGYTGTIHPERVDVDLIEALARSFPGGTVALVGPNMLPEAAAERLNACGNIVFTGPVAYAEIPDYMRAFDVCITPHQMTPFTESLNPIKLWEYLAAGKPIVATDVAGFRDYPDLVKIARDAESFMQAVRAALAEDGALAPARRAIATEHSWESRVDNIEEVIARCLQRYDHADKKGESGCTAPREEANAQSDV